MIKLFGFLKPRKKQIAFMLILLFVQVLGTLYIPTLTANIINNGIIQRNIDYVWNIGTIMLIVALFTAIVSILVTYLSTYIATGMGRDIRRALFRKSQSFSVNDFNQFGAASLITRSTNDVTQVQQSFSAMVEMLLPAPIMTITGLVLTFSKNRFLALTILGVMLLIIILAVVVGKKIVPIFEKLQTLMDNINRKVRESIMGVRVIRAFNRTKYEKKCADQLFTEYADTAIKANKMYAVVMPFVMLVMNLCTLLIICVGGQQFAYGKMAIGDILAIIDYTIIILMYLIMGIYVIILIPHAQVCAARINAVLDVKPEFSKLATLKNQLKDNSQNAKVEFRQVKFHYEGAEEDVLHDISFTIQKGQVTAIIGSTGAGKSTIGNLLMRFYDIQSGSIMVDGKDIREYSEEKLRESIGYVPQKAFLFSGTIEDNLRHGKKDATAEEMHHAAKIAQIDDFINSLDKGLKSSVAQSGSNFSGGQKQRLSIARAIVKRPDIYFLDDSFSALDFKTDAKLRAALKEETTNSAVIIVAQRISSIMDAHQIIVLDDGRIVGKGTHKELLKNCSVYQQIANSQLSEEELA